jgi:N4-gp56 family major capsid protein
MADALTTTNEVDPAVATVYERTLLEPAYPQYVHNQFAERFSIASKKGNTIKMRRYARYSAATTPLTEGITPNGHRQSKVDLLAEVSQYGDFATLTDVVDLTVEDPNILIEVRRQADQMRNTEDQLTRDVLATSASSTTCSNGSGTVTLLNRTDIRTVRGTLRSNNAQWMTRLVKAGTGQGTSPIPPAYWAIADTDLENDLEVVAGWKSAANYSAQMGVDPNEWGYVANIRWITTTQGYVSGSNYSCPVIAKNAYGVVSLDGGNASSIVKAFGSAGTADPLNQRATVGWKMWQVARILNDLFIHVIVCTNG